jgi:hypothetical protein
MKAHETETEVMRDGGHRKLLDESSWNRSDARRRTQETCWWKLMNQKQKWCEAEDTGNFLMKAHETETEVMRDRGHRKLLDESSWNRNRSDARRRKRWRTTMMMEKALLNKQRMKFLTFSFHFSFSCNSQIHNSIWWKAPTMAAVLICVSLNSWCS